MAYQFDQPILKLIPKGGIKRSDLKKQSAAKCPDMISSSFHAVLKRLAKKKYIEIQDDILAPKEAHITITKIGRDYFKLLPELSEATTP